MKKLMLVAVLLCVALAGCGGLEEQRVKEERAALDEWKKAIPLLKTHPDISDADKKSWQRFSDAQEFRVKQQEESIK